MTRKLQLSWMKRLQQLIFEDLDTTEVSSLTTQVISASLTLTQPQKSLCTAVYGRYNFDKLYPTCPPYRRGQLDESIKNPHKTYLHRRFSAQINTNNTSLCCCSLNFITYLCSFFEHVLKHRFRDWERHVESFRFTPYTVLTESWVMLVPSSPGRRRTKILKISN